MFRHSFPGPHSNEWNFKVAAEAAAVETRMLTDDISIAELATWLGTARSTLVRFLKDGTHNKAYATLKKRGWL